MKFIRNFTEYLLQERIYKIYNIDKVINDIKALRNELKNSKRQIKTRGLTNKLNEIGKKYPLYSNLDPKNTINIEFGVSFRLTTKYIIPGNFSSQYDKHKIPIDNAFYSDTGYENRLSVFKSLKETVKVIHNMDYKLFYLNSNDSAFNKYLDILYAVIEHEMQHYSQFTNKWDTIDKNKDVEKKAKENYRSLPFFKKLKRMFDNQRPYHDTIWEIEAGAQTCVRELISSGYSIDDIKLLLKREKTSFNKYEIKRIESCKFRDYRNIYDDDEEQWKLFVLNCFEFIDKKLYENSIENYQYDINEGILNTYANRISGTISLILFIITIIMSIRLYRYMRRDIITFLGTLNTKKISKINKLTDDYFTQEERNKIKFLLFKSNSMTFYKDMIVNKNGSSSELVANKKKMEKFMLEHLTKQEMEKFKGFIDVLVDQGIVDVNILR